jgi:hypothetical protein
MKTESIDDFLKRGGNIKKVGFENAYTHCKIANRFNYLKAYKLKKEYKAKFEEIKKNRKQDSNSSNK